MQTSTESSPFFAAIRKPWKLRLFLLRSLPAAFFAGLRVEGATEQACTVSVPYKWFTKNPFRSTYFACLSMGAELSTGVLAMAQVQAREKRISMLVTAMHAQFYKKATGVTLFTCSDGERIEATVAKAVQTGMGQTVKVLAEGRDRGGEKVAEFWFEWSFKVKPEVGRLRSEDAY